MATSKKKHVKAEEAVVAPVGYTAIPIKFSEEYQSPHYLYVKEHKVREDTDPNKPPNRTLFVLNVPPYCTEGFQVAYVVFKSPAGIQAAKSLSTQGPLVISSDKHPVKTGVHKWIARYAASLVDPVELKTEVDTFMQGYDQKVAEEEAKAEEEDGVPDEEGWVRVTRKGRRPGLPRTEAANLRALEREKRKRARKELLNFYAWQHRETKREHIAQLRKKFEEDKQKIALMRAQRKFRPY
ncbi:ribosomal RNA-processing protein 7 homolog A isoform X2 [Hemicordylus capensis]|uniref:ribosomal RNA-processing protein 7 homolog A isoform X2 n=1 Tax=Hemicordylus capensis TaxID=884348 RepID=UPI00230464EB|nr:ribosomal RNA-processing protein 7 homolog A isoform X2 [Hemicordylus capensis]